MFHKLIKNHKFVQIKQITATITSNNMCQGRNDCISLPSLRRTFSSVLNSFSVLEKTLKNSSIRPEILTCDPENFLKSGCS